jgi:Flp pilus assembly protein TadD
MTDSNTFEIALREGTRLLHARKIDTALTHLEQAHALAPNHTSAALNLAGAYILAGTFKKAIPILEGLKERDAENPMVWINLGAAYLGNPVLATDEQQLNAIDAFRRALALEPKAPSVHYNIGLIHRKRGELEEAAAMFRKALKVNPGDKDARTLLKKVTRRSD